MTKEEIEAKTKNIMAEWAHQMNKKGRIPVMVITKNLNKDEELSFGLYSICNTETSMTILKLIALESEYSKEIIYKM